MRIRDRAPAGTLYGDRRSVSQARCLLRGDRETRRTRISAAGEAPQNRRCAERRGAIAARSPSRWGDPCGRSIGRNQRRQARVRWRVGDFLVRRELNSLRDNVGVLGADGWNPPIGGGRVRKRGGGTARWRESDVS